MNAAAARSAEGCASSANSANHSCCGFEPAARPRQQEETENGIQVHASKAGSKKTIQHRSTAACTQSTMGHEKERQDNSPAESASAVRSVATAPENDLLRGTHKTCDCAQELLDTSKAATLRQMACKTRIPDVNGYNQTEARSRKGFALTQARRSARALRPAASPCEHSAPEQQNGSQSRTQRNFKRVKEQRASNTRLRIAKSRQWATNTGRIERNSPRRASARRAPPAAAAAAPPRRRPPETKRLQGNHNAHDDTQFKTNSVSDPIEQPFHTKKGEQHP